MITSVHLDAVDLRRDVRIAVEIPTTLHPVGGERHNAVIGNISRYGVLVRLGVRMAIGDRLTVMLPVLGAVFAEVVWTHDDRIGCRFDEVVRGDLYEAMLET